MDAPLRLFAAMELLLNWPTLVVLALAVCSGYGLTHLARTIAPRLGMVDKPDGQRKLHGQATPLMGGVAVYVSLLGTVLVARGFGWPWAAGPRPSETPESALLLSAGLICLVGLWDDRFAMRARSKFLWQIAASLPFAVWGRTIESIELFGVDFQLGMFGVAFTLFWLVACANTINLLDGLDGLAGTIGLIATSTVVVLSLMCGRVGVAWLALIVAGSLVGFLLHNWPPAKIFLGDAGSLMIGFLVGALSIEASLKTAAGFTLVVPLVIVSVPVFDTLMAILRRKLNGQGIGQPDRGHIHHRLQELGLTRCQALLAIASLCGVMALAAVLSVYLHSELIACLLCLSILALLVVGRVFGYRETILLFHHLRAAGAGLVDALRLFRTRLLLARLQHGDGADRSQLWDQVRRRAASMGGASIEIKWHTHREKQLVSQLNWSSGKAAEPRSTVWHLAYSASRDDQLHVSLTATGYLVQHTKRQQRLDGFFRLAQMLCHHWPVGEPSPAVADELPPAPTDSPPLGSGSRETAAGNGHPRRDTRRAA